MSSGRAFRPLQVLLVAATVAALCTPVSPAQGAPWAGDRKTFASPRFEAVWRNADLAVQQGSTARSWTWGPGPWFDYKEVYKQSPNGLRQVQYFDKARMEINDPANTAGPLGGVTNGLLTVELVSGRIKLGNGTGPEENLSLLPAAFHVAGDIGANASFEPTTPTYASFQNVATIDNGYRDPNKVGQRVGWTFTHAGSGGFRQDLADQPGTDIVVYESVTGHNVPKVFDDFRNAGPVPAIVAFGHPVTDAYWIRARVAGQDRDVMVQLFERRTLTYTPSNPAAFRVEMGNVGQHYFMWRHMGMGAPWATPDPQWPIVFGSNRASGYFNVYTMDPAGNNVTPVFPVNIDMVPYSFMRTWLPDFLPILPIYGELTNANGKRQIMYVQHGSREPAVLTNTGATEYDPAVSPDRRQVVFVSDRDGNAELYLQADPHSPTDRAVKLTETTGCDTGHPVWLPDGSGIVYESNCQDGNWEIYRASLTYSVLGAAQIIVQPISPQQVVRLTNNVGDDQWPRVSPDGSRIAFYSNRDGNTEVYTMGIDGGNQTRLTTNPSRDEGPVCHPMARRSSSTATVTATMRSSS